MLHQVLDAVSNKTADSIGRKFSETDFPERPIDRIRDVAARVDEGAVQVVEDELIQMSLFEVWECCGKSPCFFHFFNRLVAVTGFDIHGADGVDQKNRLEPHPAGIED